MKADLLNALQRLRADKQPAVVWTALDGGVQRLVSLADLDAFEAQGEAQGGAPVDQALAEAARVALRTDRCQTPEIEGRAWFVQPYNPPLRLAVVGAVHIAQPLTRMAAVAGYAVTVIDPRSGFATAERFPGVTLSAAWPDDALAEMRPDTRTAIVTLTHDPKLDDPALECALESEAFYIGALGSRKTHGARLKRLTKMGFDEAAQARIHGPVGLAIGARSPAEIAVSVMAQMTARLRGAEI